VSVKKQWQFYKPHKQINGIGTIKEKWMETVQLEGGTGGNHAKAPLTFYSCLQP